MNLLCQLYAQPSIWEIIGDKSGGEKGGDGEESGDELGDDLGEVGSDQLPPLAELAPRLWPLTRHNLGSVRLAAVETMVGK